jgi:hypothetical protein
MEKAQNERSFCAAGDLGAEIVPRRFNEVRYGVSSDVVRSFYIDDLHQLSGSDSPIFDRLSRYPAFASATSIEPNFFTQSAIVALTCCPSVTSQTLNSHFVSGLAETPCSGFLPEPLPIEL